jgi:hypothetical protein
VGKRLWELENGLPEMSSKARRDTQTQRKDLRILSRALTETTTHRQR